MAATARRLPPFPLLSTAPAASESCGEPPSRTSAESTVNQVISRRMVKKQQLR
ncbi:hypothetical protein ACFU99_14475 [Streptomyces sp. NPDC057654]|uniref:hypothetical protein n=1 Tax=Streptomyces sp. NPDC057654 TaxID=3346196 RepID=UPI00369140C7